MGTLSRLFKNGTFVWTAVVIFAGSIAAQFFPLFRDFHYEYSAIFALLLNAAGVVLALNHYNPRTMNGRQNVLLIERMCFLFLIPLFTGFVTRIFGAACFLWQGLAFYVLFVPPAIIAGLAFGRMSRALSPSFAYFIAISMQIFIYALGAADFYLFDTVYFFHPVLGYFPGTVYDMLVEPEWRMLIYGTITTVYFLLLFFAASCYENNRKVLFRVLTGWFAAGVLFFAFSPALGFSANESTLSRQLGGTLRSKHFVLHYPHSAMGREKAEKLLHLHEAAYGVLSGFYGETPEEIVSFVFLSGAEKKKAIGAGEADIAKPWKRHIYIALDSYRHTLTHEIAHIFTAEFGYSPFKISHRANSLLLEGGASAHEESYDFYDRDFLASAALHSMKNTDILRALSSFGFFTSPSSYSYIVSGAFCRFIIERYGLRRFKEIYGSGFDAVLGDAGTERLQRDFLNQIRTHQARLPDAALQYYFGRGTLFSEPCPRLTAKITADATEYFNRKDYSGALQAAKRFKGEDVPAVISFIRSDALRKLKRFDDAAVELKQCIAKNRGRANYWNAMLRLGDVYAAAGKADSARYYYGSLASSAMLNRLQYIAAFRLLLLEYCGDIRFVFSESKKGAWEEITQNPYLSTRYECIGALIAYGQELKLDYNRVKEYIAGAMERNYSTLNPAGYLDAAWFAFMHGDYEFCHTAVRLGMLVVPDEASGVLRQVDALCTAAQHVAAPGNVSPTWKGGTSNGE